MNFQEFQVISPDNKRIIRVPQGGRGITHIEVLDFETKEVLHKQESYGGYSDAVFTDNENIIIYVLLDPTWYGGPTIHIWNLENNTVEEHMTEREPRAPIEIHICFKAQKIILTSMYGGISAHNIQPLNTIWNHKPPEDDIEYGILSLAVSKCGEKVAALQKDLLTTYNVETGEKLFTTPLMEVYKFCEFGDNDNFISITHPEKDPIKIKLPDSLKQ